jgi:NAD(P)-dependent dehydrogenase (short-subunit alcohol dehydrogenase family)
MTSDLRGRTILITGANSGIGRSAALALAARGANLILAGRSKARTQPVLDEIVHLAGGGDLTFVPLDLADLASVRACAQQVNQLPGPLHVLINNAGVAGAGGLTKDGFEITFGVNHLGPFLLTLLLLDKLRASAPARIVNVASRAHKRVDGIDLSKQRQPRRSRTGLPEYGASKLANVLFTKELARRLDGTGVSTYSLHPGVVASEIWRRIPNPLLWIMKLTMISNDEGAKTTIHCATAPEIAAETGLYYARERVVRPGKRAEDRDLAQRLWAASAAWVGADVPLATAGTGDRHKNA